MFGKLAFILAFGALCVSAQFGHFFENMFGGHEQQHHQQRPNAGQRGHSASMWASQADAVSCSSYLCPTTLVCVENPQSCPCPSVEDVACVIPDGQTAGAGTLVCTRGEEGCAGLEKWAKI